MLELNDLIKLRPILNINAILKFAFNSDKDLHRVRGKIDRGSPELTDQESKAIAKVFYIYGLRPNGD